ncbi:MAG: hypothetical protein ACUVWP_08825 [bacterium]
MMFFLGFFNATCEDFLSSKLAIFDGRIYPLLEYQFIFDNGEYSCLQIPSRYERTFVANEITPLINFKPYDWLQLTVGAKIRQVYGGEMNYWLRAGAVMSGGGHRFEVGMIRRSISRLTCYPRPASYDMPSAEYRYVSDLVKIWLLGTRFSVPTTTTYENFLWVGRFTLGDKKSVNFGTVIYHRGGFDGYPEIMPELPPYDENFGLFFGGQIPLWSNTIICEVVASWKRDMPKRWALSLGGSVKIIWGLEINPFVSFLQQGYFLPGADDFIYTNKLKSPDDDSKWGSYYEIGVGYIKIFDYLTLNVKVEQGFRFKGISFSDMYYSRNRVLFNLIVNL